MVIKDLGHVNLAMAHPDSTAWSTVRSVIAYQDRQIEWDVTGRCRDSRIVHSVL